MNLQAVEPGLKVRTGELGDTKGMLINPKYLMARKAHTPGTVKNWVTGHGGDVWWVEHEEGDIAPYCFNEFEPEKSK